MKGSNSFPKFSERYETEESTFSEGIKNVTPLKSNDETELRRVPARKNISLPPTYNITSNSFLGNSERQYVNQDLSQNSFTPSRASSAFQALGGSNQAFGESTDCSFIKSATNFSRTPGPKLASDSDDAISNENLGFKSLPVASPSYKPFADNSRLVSLSSIKENLYKTSETYDFESTYTDLTTTPEKLPYKPPISTTTANSTYSTSRMDSHVVLNPVWNTQSNTNNVSFNYPSAHNTLFGHDGYGNGYRNFPPSQSLLHPPNLLAPSTNNMDNNHNSATLFPPKQNLESSLDFDNYFLNRPPPRKSKKKEDLSAVLSSTESEGSLSSKSLKVSLDGEKKLEAAVSKAAFKEFCSQFRNKSKVSREEAEEYALMEVKKMPSDSQWRVYIELAELTKKYEDYDKAREYFINACTIEKKASNAWLEWSKMEEEHGRPLEALYILAVGLKLCNLNDTLLPRLIKLHERLRKFNGVRDVLSVLKHESVEKAWKSILEGCLFETRAGNSNVSRKIFKYLMKHVSWYGPIYLEAFKLEEKEENFSAALKIIRKGLVELPRYGPLWFGLMRLMEKRDFMRERNLWQAGIMPPLQSLTEESNKAVTLISKELTWRVYFEKFEAEYRSADIAAFYMHQRTNMPLSKCRNMMFDRCRKSLVQSLLLCPGNLKWKVFLVGSRLEFSVGNLDKAKKLIAQAFSQAPDKSKVYAYIESSKLEEFTGNIDMARSILQHACDFLSNDWRSFYEIILLEARRGRINEAIALASRGVEIHHGTGRIWAIFIQLHHKLEGTTAYKLHNFPLKNESPDYPSPKNTAIFNAIKASPKSGEVWCELGRCCLNPLVLDDFDLGKAQQAFAFAIHFTPQYGDTFIEYLRLELLCLQVLPKLCKNLGIRYEAFVELFLSRDNESDTVWLLKQQQQTALADSSSLFLVDTSLDEKARQLQRKQRQKFIENIENLVLDSLESSFHAKLPNVKFPNENVALDSSESSFHAKFPNLFRRCINADPNYGALWFHTRNQSNDILANVMKKAELSLEHELLDAQPLYFRAMLRYLRKCVQRIDNCVAREELLSDFEKILPSNEIKTDSIKISELSPFVQLSDGSLFSSGDFITGSIRMNKIMFSPKNLGVSPSKYFHGIDQIVS